MIKLKIDSNVYETFKSISVIKDLSTLSASFNIVLTSDERPFPIPLGSIVEIFADGDKILTGYIDAIAIDNNQYSHDIRITGYSVLQDIVVSCVRKDLTFKGPISLENLTKKVLEANNMGNIEVVNLAGDLAKFKDEELIVPELGERVYNFLQSFARKRNSYYKTDSSGVLQIVKGYDKELDGIILSEIGNNNNNVKSSRFTEDRSDLFYSYNIHNYENSSSGAVDNLISEIQGTFSKDALAKSLSSDNQVIDNKIRKSRNLIIIAEQNLEADKLKERAEWAMNLRIANSQTYEVVLVGHSFFGQKFSTNALVKVKDELCGIDEKLLIKAIEYRYSNDGSTTKLNLVHKDSFSLEAMRDDSRKQGKVSSVINAISKLFNSDEDEETEDD